MTPPDDVDVRGPGSSSDEVRTGLGELLRALPDAVQALPDRPVTAERVLAELADVQVAQEELRVAEEELRVQQDQITQLVRQHDADRRWRGHLSALVPVGLCVTDGAGALVDANPAMAAHLGTGLHRLRGKPLSVYLAPEPAHGFRDALRRLGAGTVTELRLTVTVRPRHLPAFSAHLFGFTETADTRTAVGRIQWVLVPEDRPVGNLDEGAATSTEARDPAEAQEEIPASHVLALATSLSELSALPIGPDDRKRLLGRMATLVRAAVPGADWVSITIGPPSAPQRLGSDSPQAQVFDRLQLQASEGPCWHAYQTRSVVVSDDVASDARWPRLAPTVGGQEIRSVLALPVADDGATAGVINVYSSSPSVFGPAGRRIGELATAAVAGVLQNVAERESLERLAANLEKALSSRAVIDQAKGVVMARLGVGPDDAFARLVQVSSRLNVKVRDLSQLVVEGHLEAILRAAE